MATYTTNLNLKKPAGSDTADIGDINANMDLIDAGVKLTQTAKADPTASGTAVAFIATLTQSENGDVTATKKTVATMVKSGSTAAAGLVPKPPTTAGTTKYLREDGTWVVPPDTTYTSQSASSGSSTVSLCTRGEKYTWNNKADDSAVMKLSGTQTAAGNKTFSGVVAVTNTTDSSSTATGAVKISGGLGVAKNIYGNKVYNAVWNDYAECRKCLTDIPGRCVTEIGNGMMASTMERMMPACRIVSDTFGACMGGTEEARTPIAVAGRVLAIPYRDREKYKIGDAVCSAPNGTIDRMSRREIRRYPDRIVGIVSEIPDYEYWTGGTKDNPEIVPVDGRIWVYVR